MKEKGSNLRPPLSGYEPNELPLLHPAIYEGANVSEIF